MSHVLKGCVAQKQPKGKHVDTHSTWYIKKDQNNMMFFYKISHSTKGKLIIKRLHIKYHVLRRDFHIRLMEL